MTDSLPMTTSLETVRAALDDGRLTINALDDGSGVLLDIEGEQLLTLNRTGLAMVQAVADGAGTNAEVGQFIAELFDVEADIAAADAAGFLAEIAAALES